MVYFAEDFFSKALVDAMGRFAVTICALEAVASLSARFYA